MTQDPDTLAHPKRRSEATEIGNNKLIADR